MKIILPKSEAQKIKKTIRQGEIAGRKARAFLEKVTKERDENLRFMSTIKRRK